MLLATVAVAYATCWLQCVGAFVHVLPIRAVGGAGHRKIVDSPSVHKAPAEPAILEADTDNVFTMTVAFWAEVARAAEAPEPSHDVFLMMPYCEQGAMELLVNSYRDLGDKLGDRLPDLKAVEVSFDFPPGATRLKGFHIRSAGEPYKLGSPAAAAAGVEQLRAWVERVVVGLRVCPFTHSVDIAPAGLEKRGVAPGLIGYPVTRSTCTAGVLRDFWAETLTMLSTPPEQTSTLLLSAPCFARDFNTWAAFTEAMIASLRLFRVDDMIKVIVFHPDYVRSHVQPTESPAHGHLPPTSWMPKMMENFYKGLQEDFPYGASDFQRRAPCPAINVLRADMLENAVVESLVDLGGQRRFTRVSGAKVYCANTKNLAAVGVDVLQEELERETRAVAALQE
eukprot:TRINITY_DN8233_c0_g1_i1.p2 TRINITY_DN8233_c0_g1~~TRINITY_DN8233_c0_g1_i1.p2  ORF type:complete len:395 (-),score=75.31 TRINITY_DN8233_c0_g1_i1:181-1365(-)